MQSGVVIVNETSGITKLNPFPATCWLLTLNKPLNVPQPQFSYCKKHSACNVGMLLGAELRIQLKLVLKVHEDSTGVGKGIRLEHCRASRTCQTWC